MSIEALRRELKLLQEIERWLIEDSKLVCFDKELAESSVAAIDGVRSHIAEVKVAIGA